MSLALTLIVRELTVPALHVVVIVERPPVELTVGVLQRVLGSLVMTVGVTEASKAV